MISNGEDGRFAGSNRTLRIIFGDMLLYIHTVDFKTARRAAGERINGITGIMALEVLNMHVFDWIIGGLAIIVGALLLLFPSTYVFGQ